MTAPLHSESKPRSTRLGLSASIRHDGEIKHRLLLQWLILVGVLGFVLIVVWHQGLLDLVLGYDRSGISLGILIILALASSHAAFQIYQLSGELNAAVEIERLLRELPEAELSEDGDHTLLLGSRPLPDSVLAEHACRLLRQFHASVQMRDVASEQSLLFSALEKRIKGRHSIGWLIADLMFKLGLLGTVVGFILMLAAVTDVSDFDVASMQAMLRDMSGGMRVALFTTLCGLIGGILLGLQYHLVDRGADELMATIAEVSEIYVVPRIVTAQRHAGSPGAEHHG